MKNIVECAVGDELLVQAGKAWKRHVTGGAFDWWWSDRDRLRFYEYVDITQPQCDEYERTGTLCVSLATYKKLEVLASGNMEHHRALFKVIEVRYGRSQQV